MFRNLLIPFLPSGRQLARRAHAEAERALVSHSCQAEYHAAMAKMLAERCQRLRDVADVADFPQLDVPVRS